MEKIYLNILKESKYKFDIPSWNFGPDIDKFYPVKYIVKKIENLLKLKINFVQNKNKTIVNESKILLLSNDKAKLELGWEPKLQIDESISMTMEWYLTYYNNKNLIENLTINQIDQYTKL